METKHDKIQASKEDSFKGIFEEIMEKGFVKYTEDMKAEKMRSEILHAMGITEDDLLAMSSEKRAKIEQRISEEMIKRMAAEKELNNEQKPNTATTIDSTNSFDAIENIGLQNAYFAIEDIVDKHIVGQSNANEASSERYQTKQEEEKVS